MKEYTCKVLLETTVSVVCENKEDVEDMVFEALYTDFPVYAQGENAKYECKVISVEDAPADEWEY